MNYIPVDTRCLWPDLNPRTTGPIVTSENVVTDVETSPQVAFLNRLLGSPDRWPDARTLLQDFCTAFGTRAAGARWPADGPVWSA